MRALRRKLVALLAFHLGKLPFKYLGVPLSSRELSYASCEPLLDKVIGRIKHWTFRILSYAGRLCLIHSVLSGLYTFLAEIYVLPKNLIKQIEQVCRVLL